MAEKACNLVKNTGGGVRYSTTEHIIGTWIDGKPLYEITVDFGKLPNNAVKNVAHGITGISKIVEVWAIGVTSTLGLPIPMITMANTDIGCWASTTEVTIKTQNDRSAIDGYVTFRYTKS